VIEGGCVSTTVTVKLQPAVLLDASVALQVTVVVPRLNGEPDAGLQVNVTPGQLSLTLGWKVTTAVNALASVP
jgi:hypothetical protein